MSREDQKLPGVVPAAVALALLLAACGPAERFGEGALLHPNGDVLAAGEDVRITDSVPGDAMAAGGSIVFDGFAGGSYVGAGGQQEIGGRIEGSLRAAGGSVRVFADVARNLTIAGGSLELEPAGRVGRNAYVAGGSVRLDGAVDGDLYVGAREVVLNGVVGGDVRVEAERLTLGPNARLGGDLRYRTKDGVAEIDPQAQIAGGTTALGSTREDGRRGGAIAVAVLRLLAFLVTGTVLVALFPRTLSGLGSTLGRRVGASLGFGALAALVIPLGVVVAAVTLVGLPLAAITAALFAIALYMGPVVPAVWIGGALLARPEPSERREALRRFLVGGPILAVAMLLPWVGLLGRMVAVALGLGAAAVALFASDRAPETMS
jgi:cytoskeletal protein CcmA (bactofilin family)